MFHKHANTLRSKMVHPKDKTLLKCQCGTIYHITCSVEPSHAGLRQGIQTYSHLHTRNRDDSSLIMRNTSHPGHACAARGAMLCTKLAPTTTPTAPPSAHCSPLDRPAPPPSPALRALLGTPRASAPRWVPRSGKAPLDRA